jgi:hypothetical protein
MEFSQSTYTEVITNDQVDVKEELSKIKYFKPLIIPEGSDDDIEIRIISSVIDIAGLDKGPTEEQKDLFFTYPEIPVTVTLVTASCMIAPTINEAKDISKLKPTRIIPYIESNYGLHAVEGYDPKKRSKRPKIRAGIPMSKKRRHSGNGTCMNSCIQYNVKIDESQIPEHEQFTLHNVRPDKIYKVKRFRKNNVQVPGGLDEGLRDIRYVMKKVIELERICCDPSTELTSAIVLSMINYKFLLSSQANISLNALFNLLMEKKDRQKEYGILPVVVSPTTSDEAIFSPDQPTIYTTRFDHNNVILVIAFSTPTETKPNKRIIVRISYKGKINIQGGMADRRPTICIYNYLINIFREHQDKLFIRLPETDAEYIKRTGGLPDIDYSAILGDITNCNAIDNDVYQLSSCFDLSVGINDNDGEDYEKEVELAEMMLNEE